MRAQLILQVYAACLIILAIFLFWKYYRRQKHQLSILEADDALNPVEAQPDMDEEIIVEWLGHRTRMTRQEKLDVWDNLSREEKRMQVRPVKANDMVQITLPDGTTAMTNRPGTSQAAKHAGKMIRNTTPPKKRRK